MRVRQAADLLRNLAENFCGFAKNNVRSFLFIDFLSEEYWCTVLLRLFS